MLLKLKEYIHQVLGTEVLIYESINLQKKLPLAVAGRYSVHQASLYDIDFCLAINNIKNTPFGYYKDVKLIQSAVKIPVVLLLTDVPRWDLTRLTSYKIDHIVPGNRIFMPSLLIDIRDRMPQAIKKEIPSAAQLVILYHLEKASLEGKDAKEVSQILGIQYQTASKALRWIGANMFPLQRNIRKLTLHFPERAAVIEKAKNMLISPVTKTIRTADNISYIKGTLAGESALDKYSNLSASGTCIAVAKGTQIDRVFEDANGWNEIQIWSYPPDILAESGVCDKMSLVLTLMNEDDERVHKEISKIKTEIGW